MYLGTYFVYLLHAMPVANAEHRPQPTVSRLLLPLLLLSPPKATPRAVCQAPGILVVTGIAACGPRNDAANLAPCSLFPHFFSSGPPLVSIICSYPLVTCRHLLLLPAIGNEQNGPGYVYRDVQYVPLRPGSTIEEYQLRGAELAGGLGIS